MVNIILYGAGTMGGWLARQLQAKGETDLLFADNDKAKWNTTHEEIEVVSPNVAKTLFPNAQWIATPMRPPGRDEILKDIERLGVRSLPLSDYLLEWRDLPSHEVMNELASLCADELSMRFLWDQYEFRTHGKSRLAPADLTKVYFEDFYIRRDDEHYVDCGAFDGDMVREFQSRWANYGFITAYEPDENNYARLYRKTANEERVTSHSFAISDHFHIEPFSATGDQTAHIGEGNGVAECIALDSWLLKSPIPPTLIKMDIEGYEKEGLWGARNIIKEHSPVLAICAYHKGPDLWEIPLLIHALNSSYKLYFRRYLEATWELIWYAVPPERVK